MADGYLNFDTKINEKGFNDGISKLGSLGKSGLSIVSKSMTAAVAAVGTGAAAIIKCSLDVVANMEQQVGGVETLFKDSADTVIANANKAYKTAGMSANNYMETVTSFSASLLQGLGGDTAKAAEIANTAIVDMSDNANKMGSNMRDIQNAYQGFAKQNYTMLDNLKLGYGGTQAEMIRLINDSGVLEKKISDLDGVTFDQMIMAIHKVQENLGISGTTAKEAATTIEGSINSAKAAWENFEAGVTSANDLVDTFWTATQNVLKNLGEIIPRLGRTGLDVVSALSEKIGEAVPQLKGLADGVSDLAEKLKGMNTEQLMDLGKMAAVVVGAAPALSIFGKGIGEIKTATEGFNGIVDGIASGITKVPGAAKNMESSLESAGGMLKNFGDAIALPFQDLGSKIAPAFSGLGAATAEMWANGPGGKITGAVSNTVGKVGEAFGEIGPVLSKKFPSITGKLTDLGARFSELSPKVSGAFKKIGTQISGYAGIIGDAFTPILSSAASFAPAFFKLINIGAGAAIVVAGMGLIYSQLGTQIDQLLLMMQTKGPQVITNFASGIITALPNLIAQGSTLIMNLLNAITANLPALITAGISIVSTLVSSLASQLPQLIPCAVNMILTLVTSLIGNLPQLISSGLQLMVGLASGIGNAIPQVAGKAPMIVGQLASTIIGNLPQILTAGIKIITKLALGLVQGIPTLLGKIPSMISQIKNAFTSVNWGSVGLNIIKGIASGLTSAAKILVDAAANAAESALNWVKEKLGIHSPSRVFRDQVGKMMALGMGIGFEKNVPVRSMSAGVEKAVSGLQKTVNLVLAANAVNKTVGGIKNNPKDTTQVFDFDEYERRTRKLNRERSDRPIYLNNRQINRAVAKGELVFE